MRNRKLDLSYRSFKSYWDGFCMGLKGEAYYDKKLKELNEKVQNRTEGSNYTEYWKGLGEIMWRKLDEFRDSLPPQERESLDKALAKVRQK